MKITFDPNKNDDNIREMELSFTEVSKLKWASAVILEDKRKEYGNDVSAYLATLMNVFMPLCSRLVRMPFTSSVLERPTLER